MDDGCSSESPFYIKPEDLEALAQSDGFTILRQHLAEHYTYDFCTSHATSNQSSQDHWLLTRDLLHALLVPIVELFDRAVEIAISATHATKFEDLEYAFTGSSRSAFLWLQCFLSSPSERDWCYTRGCPACAVLHTLDSEFCIRLLYAACLLSDVHYPFTIEGPTLPSFISFLESLQKAVTSDPLFGAHFFELLQPKALATRDGVEELIHQTLELDVILSQPSSPELEILASSSSVESEAFGSPVVGVCAETPGGIKLKRSKMAKKQMKLKVEEEAWLETMLEKVWGSVGQSETCSMGEGLGIKDGAMVKVAELVPA